VKIICEGEQAKSEDDLEGSIGANSALSGQAFNPNTLAGKWVGRVDCSTSYLPWYTFAANYTVENQIMLVGNFTVTAEATSRFATAVGAALPSTMTIVGAESQLLKLRLGAQTPGRARRLLNISVAGPSAGPFTGYAGEDNECTVVMAKS